MDLRRALLLFAIVLGLAAIASSIARPPEDDSPDRAADSRRSTGAPRLTDAAPAVSPDDAQTIAIKSGARPRTVRVISGRRTTLLVAVDEPGQVEIPGLGLIEDGERLTPARFDLLVSTPGRYRVRLRPASARRPMPLATLLVGPRRASGQPSP